MNQESPQSQHGKQKQNIQLFFSLLILIIALVPIYNCCSDEMLFTILKNADSMVLYGLFIVLLLPLFILSITFSFLFSSYLRSKFPSKFQSIPKLFVCLLFLFLIFVVISNFVFVNIRYVAEKSHYKTIVRDIQQVVQIERTPENNQEIIDAFSQNNMVVKIDGQTQFQYYYFNNVKKELSLIPLSDKDIYRYTISPSQQKLALGTRGNSNIYVINKNYSWKISLNQKYAYIDYYNFFFDKNDKLILYLRTSEGADNFSVFATVDLDNRTVETNHEENVSWPVKEDNVEEQDNSCSNIQDISNSEWIGKKLPLSQQGCIYIVYFSELQKEEVRFSETTETKKLLESKPMVEFLQKDNYIYQ